MPAPQLLQIVTGDEMREYRVEVWQIGVGGHVVELTRLDTGTTYRINVPPPARARKDSWVCDCPAAQHRGGQCKHVLAIKAGLRCVGVRV